MAVQLAGAVRLIEGHLEPHEVAGYVDRSASADERSRTESHLSVCAVCRDEVSDAAHIIATLPKLRSVPRNALVAAAGIAALLLIFLVPQRPAGDPGDSQHRGIATQAGQPTIIAPSGAVPAADVFSWSSVSNATRYDLRVFDSAGSVVWTTQTSDTVARRPADLQLLFATPYYWKVEARTSAGRSEESDMVEFSIRKVAR